jgi:hypothetical protein
MTLGWLLGSSVRIVSWYGLDDRAIEVRSQAETKDFSSSLCVQTGSGVHSPSCTMGTGGPYPGVKRGRGLTLTTHLRLVSRSRMSRSYTSSPLAPPWRVVGQLCCSLGCLFSLVRLQGETLAACSAMLGLEITVTSHANCPRDWKDGPHHESYYGDAKFLAGPGIFKNRSPSISSQRVQNQPFPLLSELSKLRRI